MYLNKNGHILNKNPTNGTTNKIKLTLSVVGKFKKKKDILWRERGRSVSEAFTALWTGGGAVQNHWPCPGLLSFNWAFDAALCLLLVHLLSGWLSAGGGCGGVCVLAGGGSAQHFPGITFQAAAAVAWRGKAVKAAPTPFVCPHPVYGAVLLPAAHFSSRLPRRGCRRTLALCRHYRLPMQVNQWGGTVATEDQNTVGMLEYTKLQRD